MMRIFFTYILPLVLPTAVYFLFMLPAWRRAKAEGQGEPPWQTAPWLLLSAAGVVLMGASLWYFAVSEGAPPWSEYAPPQMEDGEIVPGHFGAEGKQAEPTVPHIVPHIVPGTAPGTAPGTPPGG